MLSFAGHKCGQRQAGINSALTYLLVRPSLMIHKVARLRRTAADFRQERGHRTMLCTAADMLVVCNTWGALEYGRWWCWLGKVYIGTDTVYPLHTMCVSRGRGPQLPTPDTYVLRYLGRYLPCTMYVRSKQALDYSSRLAVSSRLAISSLRFACWLVRPYRLPRLLMDAAHFLMWKATVMAKCWVYHTHWTCTYIVRSSVKVCNT